LRARRPSAVVDVAVDEPVRLAEAHLRLAPQVDLASPGAQALLYVQTVSHVLLEDARETSESWPVLEPSGFIDAPGEVAGGDLSRRRIRLQQVELRLLWIDRGRRSVRLSAMTIPPGPGSPTGAPEQDPLAGGAAPPRCGPAG
jgi:hypothetical protein